MPNFSPYSTYGYLALVKEATAGTAVTPTNYLRISSESISASYAHQEINEIAGDRERRQRSIEGQVEIGGDIEFFVEPKMIGHFLRSVFGAPTTQTLTAATAFRHTFAVTDTPLSYTIDIQRADAPWVHRYYGCYFTNLSFSRDDNALKVTATTLGTKAFTQARVTVDANSGTTVNMDQTSGLVAGDSILIIKWEDGYTTVQDREIASITSETALVVTSALDAQIDVDDIVVIKRAAVTQADYDMDNPFMFQGGTQIYAGADIDNTTAECKEDMNLTIMNEMEARYCSGLERVNRYPSSIITKGFLADGQVTKFYDNESYLDKMRANVQFAIRVLMEGETALEANSAVKARTYWGTGTGFYVEASAAGKAGNDYNVTLVLNTTDTLAASISGKNILVKLANATASKNTGTLIAAAVNALTGVDAVVESTGAEQFTAAVANTNLGDTVTGATAAVVGRDASEQPYLQFDFPAAIVDNYEVAGSEDEIITQEIPLKFYKDIDSSDDQRKGYTVKARLVNSISAY
jgi:hypothetical protein